LFGNLKFAGRVISNVEHVVAVQESRCVRLKHKRSTCQVCVTNCPTQAIRVGSIRGHVSIDWEKCVACGICANVCNTEVYSLKQLNDRDLLEHGRAIIETQNKLEIRCRKVNDKPIKTAVEINCLGFINLAHILVLAVYGAEVIHFRHADCENCEAKCGEEHFKKNIQAATDILNAFAIKNDITLSTGNQPADFDPPAEQDHLKSKGELLSRREFFQYFKLHAKYAMAKTVSTIWDAEPKQGRHPVDFTHKYLPGKRQLLLAALRTSGKLDENSFDTSESLILTGMEIDPDKCGLCESCARFCPTAALTQHTVHDVRGKKVEAELKFNTARCVKCGLCLDACFTKALTYDNQISKHFLIKECDLLLKSK
jgi:ferredoxin